MEKAPLYSREQLCQFAIRSATLDERMSGLYEPVPGMRSDTDLAARRLAAWCRSVANGDWRLFAKRLQRDGWTMESVMPRLAAIQLTLGEALPAWLNDAEWIVPAMLADVGSALAELIGSDAAAQPFETLFHGLVAESERRRDAMLTQRAIARVQRHVRQAMAYQLLTSVTKLCALAIFESFVNFKNDKQNQSAELVSSTSRPAEPYHYARFLDEMRQSGLCQLFETTPVLLRLLSSLIRQWINATAEFLQRLDVDIDAVRLSLFNEATPCMVSKVETGLSDIHKFGRSVYIVHFTDSRKVAYKPKDLSIDAAWFDLVSWLNSQNAPIDLRAGRVVLRDGYGWAEFIAHGDCDDRESAKRFFERAGGLLCLFYLLNGTDMHEENIIAAGEYPVPIDMEMLLQAINPSKATGESAMLAIEAAQKLLTDSVLMTGLLPGFVRTPGTAMMAQGGLLDIKFGKLPEIAWSEINTDAMVPSKGPLVQNRNSNLPGLDGAPVQIADYVDSLLNGCMRYFYFIHSIKSNLAADTGSLTAFASVPVRRVLKPTRFYALLLERLRDHRQMCDGAMWSAQLDFVSRLADWDRDSEALWPLLSEERNALSDLNIPFFAHPADGNCVGDGNNAILAVSGLSSGFTEVRRRIVELDEAEITRQLNIVRLTTIKGVFSNPTIGSEQAVKHSMPFTKPQEIKPTMALDWADRIAKLLTKQAIRVGDSAAWIGLDPLMDGGGWSLVALGNDLYGGAPGVALFLAAHARIMDSPSSRELALAGLSSVRYTVKGNRAAHFARVSGIGGANGLGSLIYSFAAISQQLQDHTLIEDAQKVVRLLSDELIASDKSYDVIGGAAGCILALLKLHRESGDGYALNRAVACGQHLLRNRLREGTGKGLWPYLNDQPITGFSHGAAGFGYALAALARSTGIETFAAAARDCLTYERGLFSPKHGNWPDLRGEKHKWLCQWCNGASGIGLARIGMHRFGIADPDIKSEIRVAAETALGLQISPLDTLCCGNLGNIELLTEAGRTLGIKDFGLQASSRLGSVLSAATHSGHFGWNAGVDSENLGFFRGLSGVGYTLLRSLTPTTIPNVLIWE